MNYSVSYSAKQTREGVPYVENIEVCGCETSNPKDYERLCGKYGLLNKINNIPKDQTIEEVNILNTTLVLSGIVIGGSLLYTLVMLSKL